MLILFCHFSGYTQYRKVKLSKNYFLVLRDTIIQTDRDTIVYLPLNVKYKKRRNYENYLKNKYIKRLWDEIYLDKPRSLVDDDTAYTVQSENPYLKYEGKYIRDIYIKKLNIFSRDIYDTINAHEPMIERVTEALHEKTKTFVIKNNLFIKNDSIVDQNRLADNERLLRSLSYMHDARIYVKPIPGNPDSVDIEVVVQDVFSLGGSVTPNNITYYQWNVYDRNFLGYGQSLEYRGQYRSPRTPTLSHEIRYQKDNLFGWFLTPFATYSELNGGAHIGKQDENSITLGINRSVYMPTARLAGGYAYSNNWSVNTQNVQDTTYYNYKYNVQDVWGGVTFSGFRNGKNDYDIITRQNRARIFLATRYSNTSFQNSPYQHLAKYDATYHNRSFVLAQATYFRYDYYKTRYLYGFGRTEDLPYGYSYLINSGVQNSLNQTRYYIGAAVFHIWVRPSGNFYFVDLNTSSFYNSVHKFQDILAKGTVTYVTKVHEIGLWKSRFYFTANYTKIINSQFNGALNINDANGLQQFSSSSLTGYQSSFLSVNTNLFPRFRLLGFRFAFILLAQVAQIASETDFLFKTKPYSGFAIGFKTRNENLIFDEFECRVYIFPDAPSDVTPFKIVTFLNPKLRINIRGVGAPSFIWL
ncbi:MAG: hypothetical protein H7259_00215 [Cytophagales bacterium]|nr:hypothetical protein [Cytophaga sp.]